MNANNGQTSTTILKVAMTTPEGEAIPMMRFSVKTSRYDDAGYLKADVVITLEARVMGFWKEDDNFKLIANGLKDDIGSHYYVGEAAQMTVDLLTMLHKAVVGYAPVGRFLQLQAPD